jgi:hypothetical protein
VRGIPNPLQHKQIDIGEPTANKAPKHKAGFRGAQTKWGDQTAFQKK